METQFPANNQEERHLNKAFELLEADRVKTMLAQHGIHRETKVIRHDFRKQTAKWWVAAATVFLVSVSLFLYLNNNELNPQQLADNSLSTVVTDYNFSYRSSEESQPLFEVQKAINNKQWSLAANHLETAIAQTPATDTSTLMNIYFYQGIVNLQQNNFEAAILNFTTVANFDNGSLQKDAFWLRGLAYLKNKDFERAQQDLKITAQQKGWKKAAEAEKILEAMN